MQISYDHAARIEGVEAAEWYGKQQRTLQSRFLAEWKNAENRMAANPLIYRCLETDLRKCRFETFPYALVFRIRGDDLQVIAVMHMSRQPGYWKKRD